MSGFQIIFLAIVLFLYGYYAGSIDRKQDQSEKNKALILECEKTLPRDVHCEVVHSAQVMEKS